MNEIPESPVRLVDLIRDEDPIVKYGDPVLREKCKPVAKFTEDLPELIQRMEQIMREANGVGLAAPQIGIPQRIIVYDPGEEFRAVVNPVIIRSKGEQTDIEGCLSLPGLQGEVTRSEEILVKGFDEYGKPVRIKAEEFAARVLQHEIDHLDGILFIDPGRADPATLHWITADEEEEERADGSFEKITE